jgi:hypothetical protein
LPTAGRPFPQNKSNMRTRGFKVYLFDDLSDQAKLEAIEDVLKRDNWWESVIDMASTCGIKIISFDVGENRYAAGCCIESIYYSKIAENILQYSHNEDMSKLADEYLKQFNLSIEQMDSMDDDEEYNEAVRLEKFSRKFLLDILNLFSLTLQKTYDESKKSIVFEFENTCDYWFTEDGKIFYTKDND